MVESTASSAIDVILSQTSKINIREGREGRVSIEELMLLLIDLNYRQVIELRREILEPHKWSMDTIEGLRQEMYNLLPG